MTFTWICCLSWESYYLGIMCERDSLSNLITFQWCTKYHSLSLCLEGWLRWERDEIEVGEFLPKTSKSGKGSAKSDLQSKDPKWSPQHPDEPQLYNELHALQRGPSLLMNTAHYKKSQVHWGEGWEAKSSRVTLIGDERMVASACTTWRKGWRNENGKYQV